MGIPGLFASLRKRISGFVKDNIDQEIDYLYIDGNTFLHRQCGGVAVKYGPNADKNKVLDEMCQECINYVLHIVEKVQPKKEVFLAIDGVAPMGKMKQQRHRRFMSVVDKKIINSIKRKFNQEKHFAWDSNNLTPGTPISNKICKCIEDYFKKNKLEAKFVMSDGLEANEGEHKIIRKIKNLKNKRSNIAIYGLDADLLVLSLSLHYDNLYIVRESDKYVKRDLYGLPDYVYVPIELYKEFILDETHKYCCKKTNDKRIVEDYIIMCFILGNDFLPSVPSLRINNGDDDFIMESYGKTFNKLKRYLVDTKGETVKLNLDFFKELMVNLAEKESERLKFYTKSENRIRRYQGDSYFEKKMYNFENNIPRPKDTLQLGHHNYKERYYNYYFNHNNSDKISKICRDYVKTIVWVANYYFKGVTDWRWYYQHDNAPFISDLAKYTDNWDFEFDYKTKPFTVIQQQVLVLPPDSFNILPNKYRKIIYKKELQKFYPRHIEFDTMNKRFRWQCVPKLPILDIPLILKFI